VLRKVMEGPMAKPDVLGERLGQELLSLGAHDLMGARSAT